MARKSDGKEAQREPEKITTKVEKVVENKPKLDNVIVEKNHFTY